MAEQTANLTMVRQTDDHRGVIIFLHGFSGNRDDTWDRFPGLVGTHVPDWDIFTLGYDTTFQPDLVGVWSADPDLPLISGMLATELTLAPLRRYADVAFVAHSMGGLVVQDAIIRHPAVAAKTRRVILFGTPSAGLRKASVIQFWKRQLDNMSADGRFIRELRAAWSDRYPAGPAFDLRVVTGSRDQFVPPESSQSPFPPAACYVVPGNHVEIVKPAGSDSPSVRLVVSAFSRVMDAPPQLAGPAAEVPEMGAAPTETEVVAAALALERDGDRPGAIALLERHRGLGTDVVGTLAGRHKRVWLETGQREHAVRALELYLGALDRALVADNPAQIQYHAINVAFLEFVANGDRHAARAAADLALAQSDRAPAGIWNLATQAEAQLYRGEPEAALTLYRAVKSMAAETWQFESVGEQAALAAAAVRDPGLMEAIDRLFAPPRERTIFAAAPASALPGEPPSAPRAIAKAPKRTIFVSYAHEDAPWLAEIQISLAPYLHSGDQELSVWDDRRLGAGDDWRAEIERALNAADVAVLLVSRHFLASRFIRDHEMPAILRASAEGRTRVVWVAVSASAYGATPLVEIQAANDPDRPLSALTGNDRDVALVDIAETIQRAVLAASERRVEGSA